MFLLAYDIGFGVLDLLMYLTSFSMGVYGVMGVHGFNLLLISLINGYYNSELGEIGLV
jgi:hypothetical protein